MGDVEVQTEVDIAAPPSVVWKVLTDSSGFPAWNPMVTRASGPLTEGSVVALRYRSHLGLPLHFKVRITRAEAGCELRWVGSRLGIEGHHYFRLIARAAETSAESAGRDTGCTHFVHGEIFRGWLASPLGFLFQKQAPVFHSFNRALKDEAERRNGPAGPGPTGGIGPGPR